MARADDVVQEPDTHDAVGRPVFLRSQGQGMMLFVEARQGASRLEDLTYDPIGFEPGIEIIASQPLGDGSPAVCDYDPPLIGGVPGVDPLAFDDSSAVRDAVADLGCRFNDGTGAPRGRNANNACTRDAGALYSFIDPESDLQYCLPIAKAWAFPVGDTIVAARVRDLAGNVSAVSEIVIRVAGDQPFDCSLGLGERDFLPQTPASRLVVNEQGTVSLDAWSIEALRLCAGPDVGGGVHALNLREDAILGIPLTDGETLCVRFRARGSDGVLDCGNSDAAGRPCDRQFRDRAHDRRFGARRAGGNGFRLAAPAGVVPAAAERLRAGRLRRRRVRWKPQRCADDGHGDRRGDRRQRCDDRLAGSRRRTVRLRPLADGRRAAGAGAADSDDGSGSRRGRRGARPGGVNRTGRAALRPSP